MWSLTTVIPGSITVLSQLATICSQHFVPCGTKRLPTSNIDIWKMGRCKHCVSFSLPHPHPHPDRLSVFEIAWSGQDKGFLCAHLYTPLHQSQVWMPEGCLTDLLLPLRQNYHTVYPSHGRGRYPWRSHCHRFPRKVALLRITCFLKELLWIRLLSHLGSQDEKCWKWSKEWSKWLAPFLHKWSANSICPHSEYRYCEWHHNYIHSIQGKNQVALLNNGSAGP